MTDLVFRRATPEDKADLLALYRQMIGLPGCTWVEEYPAMENIEEDLSLNALYVLTQGDALAAAVTLGPLDDTDELPGWEGDNGYELSRLCVRRDLQGRGVAGFLLDSALAASPCRWVRLLVSPGNTAAVRLYTSRGFTPRGKTHMYGHDYTMMERRNRL